MTRLYIAGPMSNLPQFNFPAFHAAARALRANGYEIVSPAETDPADVAAKAMLSPDGKPDASIGETWGDALARDVKMLADGYQGRPIDGICFLPGWTSSRGARLEAFVGLLTGKLFFTFTDEGRAQPVTPSYVRNLIL